MHAQSGANGRLPSAGGWPPPPDPYNTDLVLAKDFRWTEVQRIELRLEAFNVFNHTQFGLISAASPIFYENIQASNFGQTLTANPGRVVQLGAKIYF